VTALTVLACAVMNIENSILPVIAAQERHGASRQGLNAGAVEEHVQDKLAAICTFSSIFSHPKIYKRCQALMEEHEEHMVAAVIRYSRHKAGFNLVTNICVNVTSACPASTNSTESEVVKPKSKYQSERPVPGQAKGSVWKIVAAEWMDRVINSTDDVVVFHHAGTRTTIYEKMEKKLREVAEKIGHCEGLTIGRVPCDACMYACMHACMHACIHVQAHIGAQIRR
jgi:hypothetical protein